MISSPTPGMLQGPVRLLSAEVSSPLQDLWSRTQDNPRASFLSHSPCVIHEKHIPCPDSADPSRATSWPVSAPQVFSTSCLHISLKISPRLGLESSNVALTPKGWRGVSELHSGPPASANADCLPFWGSTWTPPSKQMQECSWQYALTLAFSDVVCY
jgi:hypothetical protein